ncbi:amidase domain-containing protein [Viridibacillus arvi]|uniref:amidase domain-containing protein n=1 Tax=Viridibacillus arvi TaxID=263475 RepID=UPI0036BCD8BA
MEILNQGSAYTWVRRCDGAVYNRQAAVAYADKWWDSYNPSFPRFDVDCTNYISQCLLAGGGPMWGSPNRSKGWWLRGGNWSFSWSTPHALRWYLETSKKGLRGKRVASAYDLELGDIIFYDFQDDGRIDHSVIVTSFQDGEPLVNAHTSNSFHRPWEYLDSTAYTPNMKYYFFHIEDDILPI